MDEKAMTNEQKRIEMAEKLWLSYFIQFLYEKGCLSESQRNRLEIMVAYRNSSANSK